MQSAGSALAHQMPDVFIAHTKYSRATTVGNMSRWQAITTHLVFRYKQVFKSGIKVVVAKASCA